jgi:lipoprotein-anchoring transpeptidase ErfK/SrfK
MCSAAEQVFTSAVTTGASDVGNGTPVGTWHVQDKQTNRDLVGPGYRDHVKFWVPFNGDFGFHDASWQTMAYGSSQYQSLGSHGCVHLPAAAMSRLFGWVRVGATVTVEA